ncbi:neuroligin-2-like [Homarus americanus]|uniref:neuroligin-2-like n=1 Tax=Homarus americanus TaxID=6706 RepID=UPI001C48B5E5|nr:neuroligin-2-like [Homarus americanus]
MRARAPPVWAWAACVVLVVVAGVVNCESLKKTPTIVTKYGQLSGFFRQVSGYGMRVATYLGVPYATPPVGANRFSPTRTLSQWVGVHEATQFGPACPQRLPDISNETAALTRMSRGRLQALRRYLPALRRQSEDCLYLNLYVPDEGKHLTYLSHTARLLQSSVSRENRWQEPVGMGPEVDVSDGSRKPVNFSSH